MTQNSFGEYQVNETKSMPRVFIILWIIICVSEPKLLNYVFIILFRIENSIHVVNIHFEVEGFISVTKLFILPDQKRCLSVSGAAALLDNCESHDTMEAPLTLFNMHFPQTQPSSLAAPFFASIASKIINFCTLFVHFLSYFQSFFLLNLFGLLM